MSNVEFLDPKERAQEARRSFVETCEREFVQPIAEKLADICGVKIITDTQYLNIHPAERAALEIVSPNPDKQFTFQEVKEGTAKLQSVDQFQGQQPMSMLYVILNRDKVNHRERFSEWAGVIIMVGDFAVALVHVECDSDTGKGEIPYVRLWDKKLDGGKGGYVYCGDPKGDKKLPSYQAINIVASFLRTEGIT